VDPHHIDADPQHQSINPDSDFLFDADPDLVLQKKGTNP
jgi:hypothetical protein